jgi:3-dehydroquinate synthase
VLGYGTLAHGAAVAVGMSAAGRIAVQLGMLAPDDAARQDRLLCRLGLPILPAEPRPAALAQEEGTPPSVALPPLRPLLEAMALDKKSVGGQFRFVLARSIGSVEVREVALAEVSAALEGCFS